VADLWDGYKCRRSFEHATVYVDLSDENSAEIRWGESTFDWDRPPPYTGIPELEPLTALPSEVIDGIRWIKAYECEENAAPGASPPQFQEGFNGYSGIMKYAEYAISVKFAPGRAPNTEHHRFQVQAEVCSNAVYNLNNGFELSYETDPDTNKVIGVADLDAWIGTEEAKSRLKNTCVMVTDPRSILHGIWYHACGNGNGIMLYGNTCMWDWKDDHEQDMQIWLGFDVDFAASCHKSSGKYIYGETLAPTAPTMPTAKPTQRPTTTSKPTNVPSAAPTLRPTVPTTASPTSAVTKTPELAPLASMPYYIEDDIRWIKVFECVENAVAGKSSRTYPAGIDSLANIIKYGKYAISVKFSPGQNENADFDGFEAQAKVCSNPVYNLNHGFELSYTTDEATNTVVAVSDLDAWIGSYDALNRLKSTCIPGLQGKSPRPLSNVWYHACGNGNGMHLFGNTCMWDWGNNHEQDIEIWFGFDVNLSGYCGDNTGRYIYGEETTTTTTAKPTEEKPTLRPSRHPTTAEPTKKPTPRPTTADPTQRPSHNPTHMPPTERPSKQPTTADPTERPTPKPSPHPTPAPTTEFPTAADPTERPTTAPPTKKKKKQKTGGGKKKDGKGGKGKNTSSPGQCIGKSGVSHKAQKKCSKNKDIDSCSASNDCEWIASHRASKVFAHIDGNLSVSAISGNVHHNTYLYIALALFGMSLMALVFRNCLSNGKTKAKHNETEPLLP